jgi:hypothetical protein
MIKAGIAWVQFNPCPNPWPIGKSRENTISLVYPGVSRLARGIKCSVVVIEVMQKKFGHILSM